MKILITGSNGFIGKNLISELKNRHYDDILEFDVDTDPQLLDHYCQEADFVFHLAGVNRPKDQSEFMKGNFGFTSTLLDTLKKHHNNCPLMLASSTQALLDNDYGKSKKAGEDLVFQYGIETGAKVLVYRFPNVFGKWCRPNYNSAIATFCHNISRNLEIKVNDPEAILNLVYVDDVIQELINALSSHEHRRDEFCYVPEVYSVKLGLIVELLYSFREGRKNRYIPNSDDPFTKKLYSTYLSYLPENDFSYPLKMNEDARGSFTEFIKTKGYGQVSVNVTKPGITKGNHWHHTKNEKFLVVSGEAIIRFRHALSMEVIEYRVRGSKLEVVDIPPGYTHNIQNIGATDLVTIMWANEPFDPNNPDTMPLVV